MKKLSFYLIIMGLLFGSFACKKKTEDIVPTPITSVTDIDGNTYKVVKIGNQYWMAENLKVTHYRNGDSIPTTYPSNKNIGTGGILAYQWIVNHDPNYLKDWGRVYTFGAAIDPRGLAPEGWHIPSVAEYQQLMQTLGADSGSWNSPLLQIGSKLKDTDPLFWGLNPQSPPNNSTGFTGRAAGLRSNNGTYYGIMTVAGFITSTPISGVVDGYRFNLRQGAQDWHIQGESMNFGASVRCVKD